MSASITFLRRTILLLQVGTCVAIAPLLLLLPIRLLDRWMRAVRGPSTPDAALLTHILHDTEAVCRRARRWIPHYCTTRGLSLLFLLRRAGLPVALVFGIAPFEDGGEGHCWLTLDGKPYAEKIDPRTRFTSMYTMAPPSSTIVQRS